MEPKQPTQASTNRAFISSINDSNLEREHIGKLDTSCQHENTGAIDDDRTLGPSQNPSSGIGHDQFNILMDDLR